MEPIRAMWGCAELRGPIEAKKGRAGWHKAKQDSTEQYGAKRMGSDHTGPSPAHRLAPCHLSNW